MELAAAPSIAKAGGLISIPPVWAALPVPAEITDSSMLD
jgi:hypothetical protein